MRGPSGQTTFAFVNYEGPKLPRDPHIRDLIHRRAMKDVAVTKRRRGGSRHHNVGQLPLFLDQAVRVDGASPILRDKIPNIVAHAIDTDQLSLAYSGTDSETSPEEWESSDTLPSPAVALNLINAVDFSTLFDLTPLTGLRLGFATVGLSTCTSMKGLNMGSKKLLTFIPSRYGHVSSLSHATDCVIAKLRQIAGTPERKSAAAEAAVLIHYNKALRALQADLEDEVRCMMPETLCATVLLCVFELLGGSPTAHSWTHHAGGAARLIEFRGAQRFNTEFEMALFTAHLGPTVTEAFINNKACYQTDESWQRVMHAAISSDESFAGQHDLVFTLWSHLVGGPGLFMETTALICSSSGQPPPPQAIEEVIRRLLRDRQSLLDWLGAAQRHLGLRLDDQGETYLDNSIFSPVHATAMMLDRSGSNTSGVTGSSQTITLLALRGTYILARIIKARLLFALAPARFHALEVECQNLAERVLELREYLTEEDGGLVGNFFMSQSSWIAKGILETRRSWSEGWDNDGTIEKWKFRAWCKAIGRKCPPNEETD